MDACCPAAGHRLLQAGGGSHAQCGLPALCPSTSCADAFVPFFTECEGMLRADPSFPFQQFMSFSEDCEGLRQSEAELITNGQLHSTAHECDECEARQAAGENIMCTDQCVGSTRQGTLAGDWNTHGCTVSWVTRGGKNEVLQIDDAGMLSDLWQSFASVPGSVYYVEYNVLVEEVFDCKFGHAGCWGNGALDIHDGEHCDAEDYDTWDQQVSQGNDGVTGGGAVNTVR